MADKVYCSNPLHSRNLRVLAEYSVRTQDGNFVETTCDRHLALTVRFYAAQGFTVLVRSLVSIVRD